MGTVGTWIQLLHGYSWYMGTVGTWVQLVHGYSWYMGIVGTWVHGYSLVSFFYLSRSLSITFLSVPYALCVFFCETL